MRVTLIAREHTCNYSVTSRYRPTFCNLFSSIWFNSAVVCFFIFFFIIDFVVDVKEPMCEGMIHRISQMAVDCLICRATINFSRRTLLHEVKHVGLYLKLSRSLKYRI
jgi:hypothetical protein